VYINKRTKKVTNSYRCIKPGSEHLRTKVRPLIEKEKDMEPNPHYINMLINIGIFALLVYVAINV